MTCRYQIPPKSHGGRQQSPRRLGVPYSQDAGLTGIGGFKEEIWLQRKKQL